MLALGQAPLLWASGVPEGSDEGHPAKLTGYRMAKQWNRKEEAGVCLLTVLFQGTHHSDLRASHSTPSHILKCPILSCNSAPKTKPLMHVNCVHFLLVFKKIIISCVWVFCVCVCLCTTFVQYRRRPAHLGHWMP